MKITRRQIRQIIKEAMEPMTPDYVHGSMVNQKSVRTGIPFMTVVMDGIASGNLRKAANAVMDALMIDDPPMGADVELEELLASAQTEDDVASIASEWGTRHFRSR